MSARIALCLLLAQTQFPFPDVDLRRDIAETETKAYFLGPSKHVLVGAAVEAEFSNDDQKLAILTKGGGGYSVSVWSRGSGKAIKALDTPYQVSLAFQGSILWVTPAPNGEEASSLIYRFDAAMGRSIPVIDTKGLHADAYPSPQGDGCFLLVPGRNLLYMYVDGRLMTVPVPTGVGRVEPTWEFGVPSVYLMGRERQFAADPYAVDPRTGALGDVVKGKPLPTSLPRRDLKISLRKGKLGLNTISGHWLEEVGRGPMEFPSAGTIRPSSWPGALNSGKLTALIAADQKSVRMGRNQSILTYWDRHNVFVREIKSMPMDEFEKAFAEREKQDLMDQAKMAGLAMMIYASDADDLLPINDGTLDRLFPYSKDSSIFDNFQYVMNGESLTAIGSPSETVLGRVQGRYGRALVYADGHVIWDPKRKP